MSSNNSEKQNELTKDDKAYLNNGGRVAINIAGFILEYVVLLVVIFGIISYSTGKFDMDEFMKLMQPGQFVFVALVGAIPVLLVKFIKNYYGIGTFPRMGFGLLQGLVTMAWIYITVRSVENISVPNIVNGLPVESVTIGLEGIGLFMMFVVSACLIIPLLEFIFGRDKHKAALAKKERIENNKKKMKDLYEED